jgi:hypothetical protein
MPRSFNLAAKIDWKGVRLNDPRVLVRALIGVLLAANLVLAVIVFKPFGGSADDLRRQQQQLNTQWRQMQTMLEGRKRLVANMDMARTQGEEFLSKYVMDARTMAATTLAEMNRAAVEAGARPLPSSLKAEPIEGSDTLKIVAITQGFEGNYATIAKLVNIIEKSPQFLILDTMALNAPQQTGPQQQNAQQMVNVSLTVLAFERDVPGATP